MKRKEIIFIEAYQTVMVYKIAKQFKNKNYKTILIRILDSNKENDELLKDGYDKIIDLNLSYFKINKNNFKNIILSMIKLSPDLIRYFISISKLKPYVVIGRSPLNLPIALFRIFFYSSPFVYFPYDVRTQYAPNKKIANEIGIPNFEIWAERFCFEHSDGVIHKGDPDELNYINNRMIGNSVRLPKHQISFHPYCSKDFIIPVNHNKLSNKDKEFHAVEISAGGNPSKEHYIYLFKSFESIINQGIHIHMYTSLNVQDNKNDSKDEFIKEYGTHTNFKYFHLHPSFNPKDIVKEISKYDFGVAPYLDTKEYGIEKGLGVGNRISTYLEAGIPFFYTKNYTYTNKLLNKYGITFIWPDNVNNIKKGLKKLDFNQLEKNVLKMREDYLMEKQFSRFLNFIEKIV